MNRLHLASAIYCLDNAFNFNHAPFGPDFWYDVRRRLVNYHAKGDENLVDKADHGAFPGVPLTKIAAWNEGTFLTLNADYAQALGQGLNQGLSWMAAKEPKDFWHQLFMMLYRMPGATNRPRLIADRPDGTYCTYGDESHSLAAKGWEQATILMEAAGIHYRPGMFPHHDPVDKRLVRYIPADKPATQKNFVTAKPGKFLASFYADALSTTEIADIAAKFRAYGEPPKLLLAHTAEEIEKVYRNGPASCMASGKSVDGISPVRAYASGDWAVAYTERDGRPNSRCLVHPALKIYVRIYGDYTILKPILEKNGYIPARDPNGMVAAQLKRLEGARLMPIPAPNIRPADAKHEAAGEPVLITPFFDLSMKAYYDPGDNFIKLTLNDLPKGRIQHGLAGGYSIGGISATKPPRAHETSADHFYYNVGSGGNNGHGYMRYTDAGRMDLHPHKAKLKPAPSATAPTVGIAINYIA